MQSINNSLGLVNSPIPAVIKSKEVTEKDLPLELFVHFIFNDMSNSDLSITALVSKKWYQASINCLKQNFVGIKTFAEFAINYLNPLDKKQCERSIHCLNEIAQSIILPHVERDHKKYINVYPPVLNPITIRQANSLRHKLFTTIAINLKNTNDSVLNKIKEDVSETVNKCYIHTVFFSDQCLS